MLLIGATDNTVLMTTAMPWQTPFWFHWSPALAAWYVCLSGWKIISSYIRHYFDTIDSRYFSVKILTITATATHHHHYYYHYQGGIVKGVGGNETPTLIFIYGTAIAGYQVCLCSRHTNYRLYSYKSYLPCYPRMIETISRLLLPRHCN